MSTGRMRESKGEQETGFARGNPSTTSNSISLQAVEATPNGLVGREGNFHNILGHISISMLVYSKRNSCATLNLNEKERIPRQMQC